MTESVEEKGSGFDGVYTVIVADDGSLPAKTDEAKQAMLRQRKMFEMDSYYKYIADHTYNTEFVPVTLDEARALKLRLRGIDLDDDQHSTERQHLAALEDKMDIAIRDLDSPDGAFFIRMSTRSPKDAGDKPFCRERLQQLMGAMFEQYPEGPLKEEYQDLNFRLIGFRECMSKVLCVGTRQEMLELLSYSERCVSDLKRLIDHRHLLDQWDLYLVIRHFEFIPIQNEFRCFVSNGRLTAISQYFPHCLFPQSFRESTERIKTLVQDFYENVVRNECALNDKLHDSYVLDLNVDLQSGKVIIIELNPFAVTTGPGFFDWEQDSDLLHGRIEEDIYPELRIRTEVEQHLDAVLSQWDPVFRDFERLHVAQQRASCCTLL